MAHVLRNSALPRRAMLRGLATTVALPWLEAMAPTARAARAAAPPRRLAFLYAPNGMIMPKWSPTGEGEGYTLSPTLEPLAPFRDDITIISGLCHANAEALGDGPGDHARAAGNYLTGVHPKKSPTEARVGISADQLAARERGGDTRLASLELTCDKGQVAGACDSGYNCAYQAGLSWRSETTPVPYEVDPRQVFDRLFGNPGEDAAARETRLQNDASVLDLVAEDAHRLNERLGGADRRKLDEYLTSVRALERQVQQSGKLPTGRLPAGVRRPSSLPRSFEDHLRLMADLMVLALQTDSTRIVTFMFSRELSNRTFPALGAHEGHHDISHHSHNAEKIELLTRIDRHLVTQFARVLQKLRDTREADATLLDSCMLVYGSGLSDGNKHQHVDLPTILAGRGGGSLRPGRHLRVPEKTPMCNLWVSLLQRMNVPVERFGDSTAALAGV